MPAADAVELSPDDRPCEPTAYTPCVSTTVKPLPERCLGDASRRITVTREPLPSPTNRRSILEASGVAFGLLIVWWGGVLQIDGALATRFPYHRYETLALLYPDVFYPALPGWILAHVQPSAVGFWFVVLGWMIALSVAIGSGAARYASGRNRSPTVTALVFVGAVFVAMTLLEAAAAVLG